MMTDRRVRIYDEGRADRILSAKRYSRRLPVLDATWISQTEIVKRIEHARAQAPCCSECGRAS
jgi:hypothetical protein